jgi:hypothetical protein
MIWLHGIALERTSCEEIHRISASLGYTFSKEYQQIDEEMLDVHFSHKQNKKEGGIALTL